jgi:hypothetical protein
MFDRPFTPRESSASFGHPANCMAVRSTALFDSVRIVRTGRGTWPLPLHPLPSSLFRRLPTSNPNTPVDTDRGRTTVWRFGPDRLAQVDQLKCRGYFLGIFSA